MNKNETVTTSQNRAVIYARFSSAAQNEATIETQVQRGKEIAERYGKTIVEVYIDERRSGTTDRRPSFQRLMADAREHKFDYVILYLANRFSRNYRQSTKYYHELRDLGIRIITADRDYREYGKESEFIEDLLWNLDAREAEAYSAHLSQVIKDAQLMSLSKGTAIGGRKLLGYRTNPDTKKIEIVPEEASIVRDIFNQIAQGIPLTMVYENINNYGYRTKSGELFTVNSFQHAVRNRKYLGEYSVNNKDYPDHFPRIIEPDLFERVQNILAEKAHANGHGKAQTDYLLSGKIFCGYCGSRLNGTTTHKKGTPHYYYNCSNNYSGRRTCCKVTENKQQIETAVIKMVKKHLNGSIDLKKSASVVANILTKQFRDEYEKPLRSEIRSIETNIANMVEKYAIAPPSICKSLEERIETLTSLKANKEAELNGSTGESASSERDILKFVKEVLTGDGSFVNLNEYIIASFINSVYVFDDRIEVVYIFNNNDMKLSPADRLSQAIYDKEIIERKNIS